MTADERRTNDRKSVMQVSDSFRSLLAVSRGESLNRVGRVKNKESCPTGMNECPVSRRFK